MFDKQSLGSDQSSLVLSQNYSPWLLAAVAPQGQLSGPAVHAASLLMTHACSTCVHLGCCRVVSEWKFEKDGVELGMRDLASSTRGAQLEDTSTFIALGRNRYISVNTSV